jgi:AraC-like DNA-binding protein
MKTISSARHQMNVWGDADCSLIRFDLSGGAELELDQMFHDDVVILAFEGCGWISREGGHERQERPGDIIMRRAEERFSIRTDWIAPTGGTCREIHISGQRFDDLVHQEGSPLAGMDFGAGLLSDPLLAREFAALHTRFERAHDSLEAFEALAGMLGHLASRLSPGPAAPDGAICRHGVGRVIEYLRAHAQENLSLDDLAVIAQMNRFVLLRHFQAQVGVSPHEYQRMCRIRLVKKHLRDGMPLAQLAAVCGYFDQSHMTREFKRRTGLTPTAFIPQSPQGAARL